MDPAQSASEPRAVARARQAESAPQTGKPAFGLVQPPPPGLRARQLLHEAQKASVEHIGALKLAILTVRDLADAVVAADELYGPGLSQFAERLTEDLLWRSKTLELLSQRQRLQLERSSDQA
jgi:hypothetical protein